jgi:hypothetical protein
MGMDTSATTPLVVQELAKRAGVAAEMVKRFKPRGSDEVGGLMSYGASLTDAFRTSSLMPAASWRVPSLRTCQ